MLVCLCANTSIRLVIASVSALQHWCTTGTRAGIRVGISFSKSIRFRISCSNCLGISFDMAICFVTVWILEMTVDAAMMYLFLGSCL